MNHAIFGRNPVLGAEHQQILFSMDHAIFGHTILVFTDVIISGQGSIIALREDPVIARDNLTNFQSFGRRALSPDVGRSHQRLFLIHIAP
jgi:hypothetical protein